MKRLIIIFVSSMVALFLISCGVQTKTSVPDEKAASAAIQETRSSNSISGGWAEELDKTLKAAKTEKNLVIYTYNGPEVRQALSEAFVKKFGLPIEFLSGRSTELVERMNRESRAGIDYVDLFISGSTDMIITLKPAGALAPLRPLLFLPEVLDPKAWATGELPFADKEKQYVFVALGNPGTSVILNTTLVRPEEIKSYNDLLNIKWKGKIIMSDPTVVGSGLRWFGAMTKIMSLDYLRKLAEQMPAVTRDRRLQAEWLAQGKYPLGLAAGFQDVSPFIEAGAPLRNVTPVEGTYISGAAGSIVIIKKAPHPNAAKLFINWYLSREGQTVFTRAHVSHSGRIDVPYDFLPEGKARIPDGKYIPTENEDFLLAQAEQMKWAQELMGHLLK